MATYFLIAPMGKRGTELRWASESRVGDWTSSVGEYRGFCDSQSSHKLGQDHENVLIMDIANLDGSGMTRDLVSGFGQAACGL